MNFVSDLQKGAYPIGHVSHRKDGDYKKISRNEWRLVPGSDKRAKDAKKKAKADRKGSVEAHFDKQEHIKGDLVWSLAAGDIIWRWEPKFEERMGKYVSQGVYTPGRHKNRDKPHLGATPYVVVHVNKNSQYVDIESLKADLSRDMDDYNREEIELDFEEIDGVTAWDPEWWRVPGEKLPALKLSPLEQALADRPKIQGFERVRTDAELRAIFETGPEKVVVRSKQHPAVRFLNKIDSHTVAELRNITWFGGHHKAYKRDYKAAHSRVNWLPYKFGTAVPNLKHSHTIANAALKAYQARAMIANGDKAAGDQLMAEAVKLADTVWTRHKVKATASELHWSAKTGRAFWDNRSTKVRLKGVFDSSKALTEVIAIREDKKSMLSGKKPRLQANKHAAQWLAQAELAVAAMKAGKKPRSRLPPTHWTAGQSLETWAFGIGLSPRYDFTHARGWAPEAMKRAKKELKYHRDSMKIDKSPYSVSEAEYGKKAAELAVVAPQQQIVVTANEIRKIISKMPSPQKGRHWGTATADNWMARAVATLRRDSWRPLPSMKVASSTVNEEDFRNGMALRSYAQQKIKGLSRKDWPEVYRGMALPKESIDALLAGAETIPMTGATAWTFDTSISDRYKSSEWTRRKSEADAQPVMLTMKRSDAFDDSVAMWHPDFDRSVSGAFEVLSDSPSIKIVSAEKKQGVLYLEVEAM